MELGGLSINAKTATLICNTLEELEHPHPPTPIQIDNSIANGVVNSKVQPKATKAVGMHFYCSRTGKPKAIQNLLEGWYFKQE